MVGVVRKVDSVSIRDSLVGSLKKRILPMAEVWVSFYVFLRMEEVSQPEPTIRLFHSEAGGREEGKEQDGCPSGLTLM